MRKRTTQTQQAEAEKVIGAITTYKGDEHAFMKGCKVRIVAVLRNAARADYNPDAEDGYIKDEEYLHATGGVTAGDRIEVQPWVDKAGRFSWVTSDPKATDLLAFEHLVK